MSATATLYTTQVLALATSLAAWPMSDGFALQGRARSPACGSSLTLGLDLDAKGRISAIGLTAHACAIGQASAAIFAGAAPGRSGGDVAAALAAMEAWLAGTAERPDWPGIEAIASAQAYPGRHGAILLPWKAALDALSTVSARG